MVIITLPAYNEEASLPALLLRVKEAMEENGFEYRVIVVNDGSSDGTASAVEALRGKLPLELVDHGRNRGLGEAVRTGLLHALEGADDRDVIVTMDSDNTHTPGLIAGMVNGIREGNDVMIASRFRAGARIMGVPLYRRVLSRGASVLFRITFPTPGVRDFTSGYRAYRAELLRRAFETYGEDFVHESGFACMVDILLKLRRLGAIMNERPLILRYDFKYGVSKMHVLRTAVGTLGLMLRQRFGRG
ncbi:MAG TPA: glycosyltransferase family 2 protein [Myxococcota bacterium]|nr:glycosyltransferase family 2 protein [Myxococcota bacterium]